MGSATLKDWFQRPGASFWALSCEHWHKRRENLLRPSMEDKGMKNAAYYAN
jgi:hypothetical protein